MPREITYLLLVVIAALVGPALGARADGPGTRPNGPARHDRPPRKVIVGTTMTHW
jgi:hypothetical protein